MAKSTRKPGLHLGDGTISHISAEFVLVKGDGTGLLHMHGKVKHVDVVEIAPSETLGQRTPTRKADDGNAIAISGIRRATARVSRPHRKKLYPGKRVLRNAVRTAAKGARPLVFVETSEQPVEIVRPETTASDFDALLQSFQQRLGISTGDVSDPENPSRLSDPAWVLVKAFESAMTALEQESLERTTRSGDSLRKARQTIELDSATGPLNYELPFSLEETLGPGEVGKLLSPSGKANRSVTQRRRQSNELLGVEIGGYYRYPRFQFDESKHRIRPVVAYANSEMESSEDPWGVLDWWYTADRVLGGQRPVDLVVADALTKKDVDRTLGIDARGMS